MADTTALKNRIRAAIKANDNQEITGPVLQQSLLDIVDELDLNPELENEVNTRQQADTTLNNLITGIKNNIDNGYVYAGIAMPSTTPVSGKVFYVAVQAGTYTNFGGTAVTEGITILKYNGASWVKEQALFTDGGVFDISAYRATGGTLATYADLTAALGTNGKNIPQSLRKGGMSVKFVQSPDNKYVQYRLMSDSFGTIESDWQNIGLVQQIGLSETVAMSQKAVTNAIQDVYKKSNYNDGDKVIDFNTIHIITDNPEFAIAAVDTNDRILYGIKADGNPYFGYGVPKQIKNSIDKVSSDVNNKYTEVKQSISDTSKHLSETSSDIDKKINLGNDVYPSNVHEVSEFEDNIHVLLDNLNHILESIGSDGVRKFFAGIEVAGNKFTTTDNPEYKAVLLDKDNKILIGIRNDGDVYFATGVPKQVTDAISQVVKDIEQLQDKVNLGLDTYPKDVNNVVDNPEHIKVLVDSDNKILEDIEQDGTHKFNNKANLKDTELDTINYEDCSQLLCDKDNKIIDSIDDKGTVTHNSKHIFKGGIEDATGKIIDDAYNHVLDKSSDLAKISYNYVIDKSSDLAKVLREKGDMVSPTDWSDSKSLEIPEPRCAYINITSSDGAAATWPTTKTANKKYWMQFWDMQGNYFKKRIILNAQGNSSIKFIKKNGAIDICNDEWEGDDTFKIKFGNWLAFDSFHLKAYYTDFFKGVSVMAYKLADEVELSRDVLTNRPWKRQLLANYTFGTDQTNSAQVNDLSLQLDNEAKCHPDAFPCIVYLDGNFYGIYAFSIKKHRDNYHMKKDIAENIHLDGTLGGSTIWNGTIDWTAFEIRNPKNLYYKEAHNGTYKYDADVAQAEIAGDEEVTAWITAGKLPDGTKISSKIEKCLKITAKVKNYIIRLSNAIATIKAETDTTKQKTLFESYFDAPSLVDYEIVQLATGDTDGFNKNWQWITLDSVHWSVCEYDKDMSFGGFWTGEFTQAAPSKGEWAGNSNSTPMGLAISLYKDDIVSMWKELTNNKILTSDNIISIADDWVKRIGTDNFKKEYKKWDEAPCCRADLVDTEHWKRSNEYKPDAANNNTYDSTKTYAIGDTCYYGFDNAYKFTAITETTGNPPLTGSYNNYPKELGYYDSFWRLTNYIKQRISVENDFINSL